MPLSVKWHVNALEGVSADDGIDHAAPHKDSEFLLLDIVSIPALYSVDGVAADHCVFPVLHHDRALDAVSEGAVQNLHVGVVFIWRKAESIDAPLQICKAAILNCDVQIRRLVKF